ncbi:endonuclease/exonuclease/phosphatase family protein [Hymenobacter rubripertinctus]|uniref:Endonuclease n=1 Tax=Hymenobacter rubripertinctus TaxID=2029981 RepID=A0A418R796_9BACT|nr:endonuclease/exonuclease/phosphatase family protein [Hymenobacter rubripertinctus]RIY13343.1 endonuclease [Hymenobacter rubripertinctus]
MLRLQAFLLYLLLLISVLALVGTLLSLLAAEVWWLQVLDFLRFQFVAAQLLVLAGLGLLLWWGRRQHQPVRRWVLVTALLGLAIQFYFLLPYAPLAPRPVADATAAQAADTSARLRLLEINVLQKNRRADLVLAQVRAQRPDVVLALETDQWWAEALRPLRHDYPYVVELPRSNTYGMVLYSRLPLLNPESRNLQQPNVPAILTGVRLPNGRAVRLFAVHPTPPVPDNHPTSLGMQDVALVKVGQLVQQQPGPALVLGDFNDVSWSFTTRMFEASGQLRNVRLGRGLFNTFNATILPLRWPLDHLFVTREFKVVTLERLPGVGSDHFPLLAELVLVE